MQDKARPKAGRLLLEHRAQEWIRFAATRCGTANELE
jgi:hypothetical protein